MTFAGADARAVTGVPPRENAVFELRGGTPVIARGADLGKRHEHVTDANGLPGLDVNPLDTPAHRGGNLHLCLIRFDLEQRGVLLDRLALTDQDLHDLGLGEPFAQVGQPECARHHDHCNYVDTGCAASPVIVGKGGVAGFGEAAKIPVEREWTVAPQAAVPPPDAHRRSSSSRSASTP